MQEKLENKLFQPIVYHIDRSVFQAQTNAAMFYSVGIFRKLRQATKKPSSLI